MVFQDYAIETPLKKLSSASERDTLHEVTIDFSPNSEIAAIRFVLKVLFCNSLLFRLLIFCIIYIIHLFFSI